MGNFRSNYAHLKTRKAETCGKLVWLINPKITDKSQVHHTHEIMCTELLVDLLGIEMF